MKRIYIEFFKGIVENFIIIEFDMGLGLIFILGRVGIMFRVRDIFWGL